MQTFQLLDFLCQQTENFDQASANYLDVVHSIGPLERRLEVLEFIFDAFNPVWPNKVGRTNQVM